jgi:hypothetical protein
MADLTTIFHHLQRQLFPALTDELGPLSALDQPFCEVISLTDLGRFTRRYEWCGNGCPPHQRTWLAHAFIAKHVYQFPTTGALIDALKSRPMLRQLCGWESPGEIPSEPTFSRAFAEFAQDQLPQQIHEHIVKTHAKTKLVGHVSRDATAIEAPERPAPKSAPAVAATPRKRGRRRKDSLRPGGGATVQGTQRQRTGQLFAQRALRRTMGARAGRDQGNVPFDVRLGSTDGHRALREAVLKPARPAVGNGRL